MKDAILSRSARMAKSFTTAIAALVLPATALAQQGLPELEAPSQGGGGFMSMAQGYLYDGAILLGLVLAVVAIMVVGSASVASFKEARERETWSKFAVTVLVGVVLILAIIWLATEAAPILSQ
ncbi:TIGR03745 family integrating conjugative element membrane protein [Billgrantia ethanolica]|uniref:TIGR03745 family integrating conjugative element membrane protein n=1 Tax=Billgrantia ethanolica TaxID=2733486 RepID=A0ABS9ABU8_9GAMM|nr:TIGR03745 family integrating conjugative element membrane protein [Halomonas ethanolica]MCE8005304.1 TIGR03745 family integrating conjugative element membrane protein [Halomonas ethanolica]